MTKIAGLRVKVRKKLILSVVELGGGYSLLLATLKNTEESM